jgi:hypothetical protein
LLPGQSASIFQSSSATRTILKVTFAFAMLAPYAENCLSGSDCPHNPHASGGSSSAGGVRIRWPTLPVLTWCGPHRSQSSDRARSYERLFLSWLILESPDRSIRGVSLLLYQLVSGPKFPGHPHSLASASRTLLS